MVLTATVEWGPLEQLAAYEEGWDLFECHDVSHAPFEAQADADFEEVTGGDHNVARLIAARALDGSPLHIRAMAFLFHHSPEEWRRIVALHQHDEYEWWDLPTEAQVWVIEGSEEVDGRCDYLTVSASERALLECQWDGTCAVTIYPADAERVPYYDEPTSVHPNRTVAINQLLSPSERKP